MTALETVSRASEAVNKLKELVGKISDRRSYFEADQTAKTLAIPPATGYGDLDERLGTLRADLTKIKESLVAKASVDVRNGGNVPILVSTGADQKRIDPSGRTVFDGLAVWNTADFSAMAAGEAADDYEQQGESVDLKGGGSRTSIEFKLVYKGDPKLEIANANDAEVVATVGGKTIRVPAKGSASVTCKPRETIDVNYSCDEAHEIRVGAEARARITMGNAGTSMKANAPVIATRPRYITVVDPLGGNVTWHLRAKPDGADIGQLGAGSGKRELTVLIPTGAGKIYLVPEPPRLGAKDKKQSMMKAEYEVPEYDVSNVPYGKTERWEPKPKTILANRLGNINELKGRGMDYWFWANPGPAHDETPAVVEAEYAFLKNRVKNGLLSDPNLATHAADWLGAARPMSRLMSSRYKDCRKGDGEVAEWLALFKTHKAGISKIVDGDSDGHDVLGECLKTILANED